MSYMSQMRADRVRGAIFFQPDKSSQQPPPVSDRSWSLLDGGQWKSANAYPVYAIPGMLGSFLLNELAQYSGNMSEVPYGKELVDTYNPHDAVRLYARMDVATTSGIPSLWVFLIIVLAILLAVVLMTSVVMHWIQRRQRRILQRRVANGEVDLETLGIKRLQVPQELLDNMPTYKYTSQPEPDGVSEEASGKVVEPLGGDAFKPAPAKVVEAHTKDLESAIAPAAPVPVRQIAFSQSTCPICLDDFVTGETTIRELPCNHIFHPECIDPFLRDNSSLCPLCKKSSLPTGYCPVQVTNLMVRRERLMRRVQRQGGPHQLSTTSHISRVPAPVLAIPGRAVRSITRPTVTARIPVQISAEQEARTASTQLDALPSPRRQTTHEIPDEVQAQGASARRAWLREQIARRQARDYEQRANEGEVAEASRPRCEYMDPVSRYGAANHPLGRRVAGRLFPTL